MKTNSENSSKDNIILICATGRSGSTTMLRILNTIPHSNICGENFGAINSLLEYYIRIKHAIVHHIPGNKHPHPYQYFKDHKIPPEWYNSFSFHTVQTNVRNTIQDMFKPDAGVTTWGFKEIRFNEKTIQYIQDFVELFPQTKVIVHIRENVRAQSKSAWHKDNARAQQELLQANKLYRDFARSHSYCYLSTFEQMFQSKERQKLFAFLQQPVSPGMETEIQHILGNNFKYYPVAF